MKRAIVILALPAALAACAGMQAPSERGRSELSTGSNIPRHVGVKDQDVVKGSREDLERQMDKAHTRPKSRDDS